MLLILSYPVRRWQRDKVLLMYKPRCGSAAQLTISLSLFPAAVSPCAHLACVFLFSILCAGIWGPFLFAMTTMTRQPRPRARSAKNRTSTLSPSTTTTTSRTASWCSSSVATPPPSTAVSSPTNTSSRSCSSEVHPLSRLRVYPVSELHLHTALNGHGPGTGTQQQKQKPHCCQFNSRQQDILKPPVVPRSVSRTVSKYEAVTRGSREQPPRRRRSLSTEEEIRTIGCFNLRPSSSAAQTLNNNNNNKSKVGQVIDTAVAVKPTWLQICDPCHRILERSLTPDDVNEFVLRQRANSDFSGDRRKVAAAAGSGAETSSSSSVVIDLADLRFIDSSTGELHNWHQQQDARSSCGLSNGISNSNWRAVPVKPVTETAAGRLPSHRDDNKQAAATGKENNSGPVNNNHPWESPALRRENSFTHNKNNNNNGGVDEIIIKNKVFARFCESRPLPPPPPQLSPPTTTTTVPSHSSRQGATKINHHHHQQQQQQQQRRRRPEDHHHRSVAADVLNADVANNNLGEKERPRLASESTSVLLASDRQLGGHRCLSSEVEHKKATQLSQHSSVDSAVSASSDSRHKDKDNCSGGSPSSVLVGPGSVSDSFEEDYQRCIESINRQLNLESRDAVDRGTDDGHSSSGGYDDVTLLKADHHPSRNATTFSGQEQQEVEVNLFYHGNFDLQFGLINLIVHSIIIPLNFRCGFGAFIRTRFSVIVVRSNKGVSSILGTC